MGKPSNVKHKRVVRNCFATVALTAGIALAQIVRQADPALEIKRAHPAGLATFITPQTGRSIPVQTTPGQPVRPKDFFRQHGHLFGITNADLQIAQTGSHVDRLTHKHTTFQQFHHGIPVFSGILKLHQEPDGRVRAANGKFYPIPADLVTQPVVTAEQAATLAENRIQNARPAIAHSELVIVDPGWYGDPPIGAHLAYHIILEDPAVPLREAFFVSAEKPRILDQWTLIETLKDREVVDAGSGLIVRGEGDSPTGDFDEDSAYDYTGDFYDYLSRGFGRDSYDDAGATMIAAVHRTSSCPNASWNGTRTSYCDGVVTDDIVAHEFGHALTQHTAGLIYQNQSGQLNESFSDILGELIDLFNGDVSDTGAPSGTPWPKPGTYIGPGTDTPNDPRTDCNGAARVDVNSPPAIGGTYDAGRAQFGPQLTPTGLLGDVDLASPADACSSVLPNVSGRIALVDRGSCSFVAKVRNCQAAGASAVIVVNNVAGPAFNMGDDGTGGDITIHSAMLNQDDGTLIRDEVAAGSTVEAHLYATVDSSVRWLVGEDSSGFGGAIRDMWRPSCAGDPDTANHPYQVCNPNDNGGVHSGSGVPNHAFAIMVDGKNFNGFNVSGIGAVKAGAVWYHALSTYLTMSSNFQDAYDALTQSATDLTNQLITDPRDGVTTVLFTAADAAQVDAALQAVEMNTDGLCGSWKTVLDSAPAPSCPAGTVRTSLYLDDFESGSDGWTVFNTAPPTPYDWVQVSGGLPAARPGTVWFADDPSIGNCGSQDESSVHTLQSPVIALPATDASPLISFAHFVSTETFYDGGVLGVSVNGGPWTQIPASAMLHNPYNNALASASRNTNPLASLDSWTGFNLIAGDWGTTLIDLGEFASGGDDVQFRFEFGKDGCTGVDGWYVDDFELFACEAIAEPIPAVSTWGLTTMTLLVITAGTLALIRRRAARSPSFN